MMRYNVWRLVFIVILGVGASGSLVRAERYPLLADTRIDSRETDNNFGGDSAIRLVKNSENGRDGSVVRGLLQLDLPDVPLEEVAEARLWMALTRARIPDGLDAYAREIVIRPLTAGFAEFEATWNDRDFDQELPWTEPGGDFLWESDARIAWNPPEDIEGLDGTWWCSWDLLPLWQDANLRDHGVVLMLDPETPPDTEFVTYLFVSREGDVDLVPYVEVTLRGAGMPGDFDGDNALTNLDIDQLWSAVRAETNDPKFDLNSDALVNDSDPVVWVEQLAGTYFGDANLDGEFNSGDLVAVFQAGHYEDGVPGNSGWADGDWDGNTDFDSGDLVLAFSGGGYEQGPRGGAEGVPEPTSALYVLLSLVLGLPVMRRRVRAG